MVEFLKTLSVYFETSGEAADFIILLKYGNRNTATGNLISGRKSREPASNNYNRSFITFIIHRY